VPRSVRRFRILPLALVALAAFTSACRTVEPWERGALAAPRMQGDPHAPNAAFLEHVHQSREATAAGSGASGAGCGCY